MGKATRWLKSLLGVGGRREGAKGGRDVSDGGCGDAAGNRKRWSFGKPPPRNCGSGEAAVGDSNSRHWQKPYASDSEREQSRRAIAVAAATAAAADAAVAAAQVAAAAAVLRLTSHGWGAAGGAFAGGETEWSAAVKIQAAFRGYLARKALRALRALVKLQALVRGYLVRKQAAEDLHRMQSLFRAQSAVLSRRNRGLPSRGGGDRSRVHPEIRHRRSLERGDETRSEHSTRYSHSRRLSASLDAGGVNNSCEDSPKIVEVDPGRPKLRSRRQLNPSSSCDDSSATEDCCCNNKSSSSPLVCHVPLRVSTTTTTTAPGCSLKNGPADWSLYGDEYRLATTAHNTPRYLNSSWAAVPVTPSKSVCGADRRYQAHLLSLHHHNHHPNYMCSTESFTAKLRSLSAPRQRPDLLVGPKKKAALYEIMESRASLSGIRMRKSCSQAQEIVGSRTVGEFGSELDVDHHLLRRW